MGNTVHLGERDCSVQRRHQKVVEEAPCPVMTPELREKMGQSAIDAAKSVNYRGAGTVEFLLDDSGFFYFLEMNTRLQVEHPVTELITGLDLVALQIKVAQGEPLGLSQADINLEGHAIEVRLYSEDPSQDFLPTSGPVDLWAPASGVGVRVDGGISTGQAISAFYDPMVAKVIGSGPTREAARLRLISALKETVLFGTPNNKDFLIQCLKKQSFIDGAATTAFIAEEFSDAELEIQPVSFADSAVAGTLELCLENKEYFQRSLLVSSQLQNWTIASAMVSRKQYQFDDTTHDLSISPVNSSVDTYQVTDSAAEQSVEIQIVSMQANTAEVLLDGVKLVAQFSRLQRGQIHCSIQGRGAFFKDLIILDGAIDEAVGGGRVIAPMHGLLLEVLVKLGDKVTKGQTLAVLEAMKMHYEIQAEIDGTVSEVTAVAGKQVAADDVLIEIYESEDA
jgi:geranyl-CoA carboxylase alpha subunit